MKIWSALFNMIAVILILFLSIAYFNTTRVLERDFDQARLNLAVEFATRAMFEKTLEIEDLGMDYTELGNVQINSSDALDIFTSLMCINYDMSTSEENKRHIENSIASAVLAGSDGFYITQLVKDDTVKGDGLVGDSKVLRWSPKIPYYVHVNNKTYAINFVEQTYASVNQHKNGASNDSTSIMVPTTPGYPLSITDRVALQSVNNQIVDTILNEMKVSNDNRKSVDYKFYLPVETTAKGVNPIDGPSVLVLMQGVDFASSQRLNSLSVSGYKVVKKIHVVGFLEAATGRRYYCYTTQLPSEESTLDPSNPDGKLYIVEDYFDSMRDAAMDNRHYTPHYEFLARKITK